MTLKRLVSGGQTGVDRGALDAALACGFPCGGWCPPGRLAEDGPIDRVYPVVEMKSGGYDERTRQNVADSDATVVIHFGELEDGTELTVRECMLQHMPYELVDAVKMPAACAAELVVSFIDRYDVSVLNVAGPREGRAPGARQYAREVFEIVLSPQLPP